MRSLSPVVVLRYVLAAAALAGSIYSLILARAQYLFEKDTAASIAAAVRLVPYNAAYVARLAAAEPDRQIALLRRAVELNPYDSQSWIQLGLYSELQANDLAGAERDYLKAADVNHMYLPKWTLANFYFRHGDKNKFFHWAGQALAVTPYSPDPIFTQMWLIDLNPARIAAAIPDRPPTLLRYAWFLVNNGHYDPIPDIVQRLVRQVGNSDPKRWGRDGMIAAIEDRLLAAGYDRPALQIWSTLSQSGWISQTIPTTANPLTNGGFRLPFYPHGFGWTPIESPGIAIIHYPDQASVRFEFSGDEAEHSVLLQQYVPVAPGCGYRLTWQPASDDITTPSGLAWRMRPITGTATDEMQSGDLLDSNRIWNVHIPQGIHLCLLMLEYRRALGTVRPRGSLTLSSVAMRAQ